MAPADFEKIFSKLFLEGRLTPQELARELGVAEAEVEALKNHWENLLFASLDKEREAKKRAGWVGCPDPERLAMCRTLSQELAKLGDAFYGEQDFNYYSNAYLPENLYVFATALAEPAKTRRPSRYLEIGVNRGISALAVWKIAEALGCEVQVTGVDPYFTDGYVEGVLRRIDKTTRDRTLQFLAQAGVAFEFIEASSRKAFRSLVREDRTFELIYIDGRHERLFPLADAGSYLSLLSPGGVYMLDDYFWRDVFQIKHLFDKHDSKLCESWKIAAYRFRPEDDNH
jgi:predicted O-methyltransferase YrrM